MANTWQEECADNWSAYRDNLKQLHSLLFGRESKIAFNMRLIKKGLYSGWEGVRAEDVPFVGKITSAGSHRLLWVKDEERLAEAVVRIFKEGIDKFFERNRPCFFYPSTEKLSAFLMKYCLDNMPVRIPPELEKMDRDSVKEEYDWWYNVADWRNNAIEEFVETVCKKYKKHVPLFCMAKFPEWAVKWIYEEAVKWVYEATVRGNNPPLKVVGLR